MADEGRASRAGERTVYGGRRTGDRVRRRAERQPASERPRRPRVRGRRPWWQRLLIALLVVLVVGAVSFFIGYLIGLKLALIFVLP
jgi:hypothetical protein